MFFLCFAIPAIVAGYATRLVSDTVTALLVFIAIFFLCQYLVYKFGDRFRKRSGRWFGASFALALAVSVVSYFVFGAVVKK